MTKEEFSKLRRELSLTLSTMERRLEVDAADANMDVVRYVDIHAFRFNDQSIDTLNKLAKRRITINASYETFKKTYSRLNTLMHEIENGLPEDDDLED